jgi:protein-S-isoprenylcysteine O-methyltransferase Ste14
LCGLGGTVALQSKEIGNECGPDAGKTRASPDPFQSMTTLDLKIPPVVVAAVTAALSWGLAAIGPGIHLPLRLRIIAAVLLVLGGIAVAAAGVAEFRQAKTTVSPTRPRSAAALVTSGIYRYTRNPMYLGLLLMLLAWVQYLNALLGFLPLALYVLYMTRYQIEPEERALSILFGREYFAYCNRVRRWL